MRIENKTIEFKREYIDDIKNTIIAFANCDGGTLYIGVSQATAILLLRELTNNGVLIKKGKAKNLRYYENVR